MMCSVYMIVFTVGLAVQILAVAANCEEGAVTLNQSNHSYSPPGSPYEGYVQLCIGNRQRILCGNTFSRVDANVVCRQLGYRDHGASKSVERSIEPIDTFSLIKPACAGHESSLLQCNLTISNCPLSKYHWIQCLPANCRNGSLRLVNGTSHKEGRVEVCVDGRWGTVCYNEKLAGTVCQQLGFGSQGARDTRIHIPGFKTECIRNENGLNCTKVNHTMFCDGYAVQCQRATNRNDETNNYRRATIILGVVTGLLALIMIATVSGCSAKTKWCSKTQPRIITQISYQKAKSTNTLEGKINTVPTLNNRDINQEPMVTQGEPVGYESMLPNEEAIEGYETMIANNDIIDDYDTVPTCDETIEGYVAVDTNNECGIDGYDYIVSRKSPPPIVPPHQPDTPPPVGGVSEDNASDYIYAVVDKNRKKKPSQE